VLDYGATLMSLEAPDRNGVFADVVLGFDDPARYAGAHPYFGGIVGRYANRIAQGRFVLDGRTFELGGNDGRHHLHGGRRGFDRVLWNARAGPDRVHFSYRSMNGEQGYPGTLEVEVAYLLQNNLLRIDYTAVTNQPTIINLTNHAYFNLAGGGTIHGHSIRIPASRYVAVDEERIPTGEVARVVGTPFDLNRAQVITEPAFDHTWVLEGDIELSEPASGRRLLITTTQPGLQFYTGNLLDGTVFGKGGTKYVKHAGLCLEPQHFPDSPNQPHFPSTVLRPGQTYRHSATYALSSA
jgi:aldose 1-epimerase